jgi:hypothetical protein
MKPACKRGMYRMAFCFRNVILCILLFIFFESCNKNKYVSHDDLPHYGKISTDNILKMELDSVVLDFFNTSGSGSFFMTDSIISFADNTYAKIFNYNCNTGELLSSHFGIGQGPNELVGLWHAFPVLNDTTVFIIDQNGSVSFYGLNDYKLTKKNFLDFHWENNRSEDYESPKVYAFSDGFSESINIYKYKGKILFPVTALLRYTSGEVSDEYYRKSHIFGLFDTEKSEVTDVFGHFPDCYQSSPMPHFHFFSYLLDNDLLYVNHPVDSLVYVYEYPDKLIYTFGYEGIDINRDYHVDKTNSHRNQFRKDHREKGYFLQVYMCRDLNLFFRVYLKQGKKHPYGLQIYDLTSHDLIADIEIPVSFQILGYRAPYIYGVGTLFEETENETWGKFYKMKIDL